MSQPVVVIQVEGVLRKLMGGSVIESGRRLYHGLAGTFRLVLVTYGETTRMETWLGMEGFSKHDHVVYPAIDGLHTRKPWVTIARSLKVSYGYDVDMVVLSDPVDAVDLIEHGHNTMLFTQAAYALPEWRPDHKAGVEPWRKLAGEVYTQRRLRADDKRMEDGLR